jgi:hypothetical protein
MAAILVRWKSGVNQLNAVDRSYSFKSTILELPDLVMRGVSAVLMID